MEAKTARALPSETLSEMAQAAGLPTANGNSVRGGLGAAARKANDRDTLLLTGSHYIVGEFLENFQRTGKVFLGEAP